MCQQLTAGLADSTEAPNLSEPQKPQYVYSTTPPGEIGMLKKRAVNPSVPGFWYSVGSTKGKQKEQQCTNAQQKTKQQLSFVFYIPPLVKFLFKFQ